MVDARSEDFLAEYAGEVARVQHAVQCGDPPTILRIDAQLVLRHERRRWRAEVVGTRYESLMRACHLPALMGLVHREGETYAPHLAAYAAAQSDRGEADPAALELVAAMQAILDAGPAAPWEAVRSSFEKRVAACIRRAAELELESLDAWTRRFLDRCGPDRDRVHFVVCAGHQPRYRQLTKLYFAALLQEDGAESGARGERRLTYAENRSEDEALTLVAAQRVDRRLAARIWGDTEKMQEDILGDAARDVLKAKGGLRASGSRETLGRQAVET